jgi:hypothetical protein
VKNGEVNGSNVNGQHLSKLWPARRQTPRDSLRTFHHDRQATPPSRLRHFCPTSSRRATYELGRNCCIDQRTTQKNPSGLRRKACDTRLDNSPLPAREGGCPSRADTNTNTTSSSTSVALTTHTPPTCPSQCRHLRLSRLPRLRSTSNSLHSSSSSSNSHSNSLHHTLRPTSIPRNSHRPQMHHHTLCRLQQRGNDSRQTLGRRRRPIRMAPTMRLQQIFQAPAAMATRMRPLLPPHSRHTRRITLSHHRKPHSTHHSPIRRSKWHGNLRQLRPRPRCSVPNSKAPVHHSRIAR